LSRNDLKPENPKGHQAALIFLSCVVIAFGIESQEIMDVQSQLLFYWEFCQTLKLGWQNGRRFADWYNNQHTRRCPSPVLPLREETRRCSHKIIPQKGIILMLLYSVRDDRLAMWPAGKE